MRIGLIAPPFVPVPPVRYGGTEQVIDDLARGLSRLGHAVRLFTVGESTCPVERSWLFEKAVPAMGMTVPECAQALRAYDVLTQDGVDVIHDHTTAGGLVAASLPCLPPVVATNHGPFTDVTRLLWSKVAEWACVVAISHAQRATAGDVPVAAVIQHGVDLTRYTYGPGDGGYLAFVGRMSAEKGVHRAIRVSRRCGKRLVIVTKMRSEDEQRYFEAEVRPLLDDDVELRAELAGPERIEVVRHAEAVLNPIGWNEPFGLVMAESLACGTPVLAFPAGAAPEIVDDGITGFLCADEDELVAAVGRLGSLERRACRRAVQARFSLERMTRDHERLYRSLVVRPTPAPVSVSLPAPRRRRGERSSAS